MRKPDRSRFGDPGTAEREIFELDRRDPFTTGFDDILCPVDDLHIAMRIDRRHVAGVEPTLRVERRCSLVLEVTRGDCRTFHLEPAERLAVPGEVTILIVGDLHLDTIERTALLQLLLPELVLAQMVQSSLEGSDRPGRAHFRHSPTMNDIDAMALDECPHHDHRASRSTDHN